MDCKWDGINLAEFVKFNPDDFVVLALNTRTRLNSRVRQGYAVAQLVETRYECLRHQYSLSIHSVNTRHRITEINLIEEKLKRWGLDATVI